MQIIIEKILSHNIKDCGIYADEEAAVKIFFSEEGTRKIGIEKGEKKYFLLGAEEGKHPVSLIKEINCPPEEKNQMYEKSQDWINKWYKLYIDRQQREAEKMLARAESPVSRRQEKINFKKEITKRMRHIKKAFISQRMEGYDFRELDLSDALFLNCHLKGSNFSNVNLQNTIFINCEIKDCVFYKAFMNNSYVYEKCQATSLEKAVKERGETNK